MVFARLLYQRCGDGIRVMDSRLASDRGASLDLFQTEVMPFVSMDSEAGLNAPESVISSDLGEQRRNELAKNFVSWLLRLK
jgi:hypothetical protein